MLACAAAAACGGSESSSTQVPTRRTGSFGQGADRFWVFARPGAPKRAFVVFLHGHGPPIEMTPTNHRPWLDHLVSRGDVVVYPQYESSPGGTGATDHVVRSVGRAWRLRRPSPCTPLVVIGYSRGGGLAPKYAASAPRGGPAPDGVVSVFPGSSEEGPVDLRRLPPNIRIWVLVGDADEVVGSVGAIALLNGLRRSGFDPDRVAVVPIRSRPSFSATHGSVYETSPQAKRQLWARVDRAIDELRADKAGRTAGC
jgi:hypothetical protein